MTLPLRFACSLPYFFRERPTMFIIFKVPLILMIPIVIIRALIGI